jgi:hypothetical protein
MGDEDFEDVDHGTDVPNPIDQDVYTSAKSKASTKQATNNENPQVMQDWAVSPTPISTPTSPIWCTETK